MLERRHRRKCPVCFLNQGLFVEPVKTCHGSGLFVAGCIVVVFILDIIHIKEIGGNVGHFVA